MDSPRPSPGRRSFPRLTPRLAALGLLVLAFPRLVAAETRYYASDAAAFQGDAVSGPGASAYVLGLAVEGGTERRSLYKDGSLSEEWLSVGSQKGRRVEHRKSGLLSDESDYAPDGRLTEERFYPPADKDGQGKGEPPAELPAETRKYGYSSSGLLTKVESFDAAGASLGSLDYGYDSRGRLSELSASGIFGSSASGLVLSGPSLAASWTSSGDLKSGASPELASSPEPLPQAEPAPASSPAQSPEGGVGRSYLTRYDPEGRPVAKLSFLDGKLVSGEKLEYDAAGKLKSSRLSRPQDKLLTETGYDEAGRQSLIVILADGKERSRESLSYDDKGRLLASLLIEGKTRTSKAWEYDGPDYSSRESTTVNGLLVSVRRKLADGSESLALYDKGSLFLERLSIGGRIKKESYYLAGSLLRVKEYP
jgi:antitoxin component YwqK of YwqJK toxin-antitoxin module